VPSIFAVYREFNNLLFNLNYRVRTIKLHCCGMTVCVTYRDVVLSMFCSASCFGHVCTKQWFSWFSWVTPKASPNVIDWFASLVRWEAGTWTLPAVPRSCFNQPIAAQLGLKQLLVHTKNDTTPHGYTWWFMRFWPWTCPGSLPGFTSGYILPLLTDARLLHCLDYRLKVGCYRVRLPDKLVFACCHMS